jgi:hypothetical protein
LVNAGSCSGSKARKSVIISTKIVQFSGQNAAL